MLIFHGKRKTAIGIFEPLFYKCPNCEQLHSTYIVAYSWYFHIFWVPLFPYEKEFVANCSECGFTRSEIKFGPNLVKELGEKRKDFRHPWWTWSWLILFLGVVLYIIIVAPK